MRVEVLVVGAGPSGVAAGATLRKAGFDDFLIIDKTYDFGGTWLTNTYPGVACDIPSQIYSFGFAPNREWSRVFAPGAEIRDYVVGIVDEYRLRPNARFGTEMLSAAWDADTTRWHVETSTGPVDARFLILAVGILQEPKLADIAGLQEFQGRVFHSSQWPDDYDPNGERVAIIGTGASAIQILPPVARQAAHVFVFQRTPGWVIPKPDWEHSRVTRAIIRRVPGVQRAFRALEWIGTEGFYASLFSERFSRFLAWYGKRHIRRKIPDPAVRRALTPGYMPGCKRVMVSNEFYPALDRDNVDLVPSAVVKVRGSTVVAADGTECEVDTIIVCSGFHVVDRPAFGLIRGSDGRVLADRWDGSPRAYQSIVPAFCPNMFLLMGPNGAAGSVLTGVESELAYVRAALETCRDQGIAAIEVREEAENEWKAMANEYASGSVHNIGGCQTYYRDLHGNNMFLYPASMIRMKRILGAFDLDPYEVTTR